jgi:hypothetical protein
MSPRFISVALALLLFLPPALLLAYGEKGQLPTRNPNIPDANLPTNFLSPNRRCILHIDNRTPYVVNLYSDGRLVSVVGPLGEFRSDRFSMTGALNAKAVFSDGSVLAFGPLTNYQCVDGSFTWSLTP